MSDKATAGPVGWRIMIQDHKQAKVTAAGLHLADETLQHAEHLNYVGQVVEMGPDCYKHAKFIDGEPWCKVGDFIVFGRYAGQRIKFKGSDVSYRFVNDDEVLAVISDPEMVHVYV